MTDLLNRKTVLVLNRNWQAVNVTTPAMAFCQLAAGAVAGLDVQGPDLMIPVDWDRWLRLPVREGDAFVGTVRGRVRVPTLVAARAYTSVPVRIPAFSAAGVRARDGNRCQYTGRVLAPGEGSIDHVVPRSRGGLTGWRNCVWACREVNGRKGSRTPAEAGLRLLREPREPRPVPVTLTLTNPFGIPDWEPFLVA